MDIKVLWTGCKLCNRLYENVMLALLKMWKKSNVSKIYEMEQIVAYGVMSLPALIINEKIISEGNILNIETLIQEFSKYE